ncbi:MAG: peptidoglycan-associated lipoprotein Pal [Candidatus Glassbacteria bacterium]
MKRAISLKGYFMAFLFLTIAVGSCGKKQPPPKIEEPVVDEEALRRQEEEERRRREEEERRKEEERKRVFEEEISIMIHFDFDRYNIKDEYKDILSKKAQLLRERPTVKIRIEGHCDEWGTNEYNLALGERRANAAREFLEGAGVSPDRLTTVSYGEEQPLDPGHDKEAWRKNRRAEFKIVEW